MINVLNLLKIYQLLKSAPNRIIHRIQITWVWWPVWPEDFSSEDWGRWSSETSPEQMLQTAWSMLSQELINGAIDQWSKWLSLVIRFHGGHIEHRFAEFCEVSLLYTFLSVTTLFWRSRRYWRFWVVHFPAAYQRIFNSNNRTLFFFVLPVCFWTFCWKPRDSVTCCWKVIVH